MRDMGLNIFCRSERRMSAVMALVFLPWLVVVLFTAGGLAALNFIGYAIMVFAAGYSYCQRGAAYLRANLEPSFLLLRSVSWRISALTAFWVRLGLPVIWVSGALAGTDWRLGQLCLWRDHAAGRKVLSPSAGLWSSFPC